MGIFKRLFGTKQIEGAMYLPKGMTFHRIEETEANEIWMRLSVSRKGDNVSIEMHGIEKVNVCLASFLTKGVSSAQEKFNEYQANKDTNAIVEEPKAEKPRRERTTSPTQREIDKVKAWAKAEQAKRESK